MIVIPMIVMVENGGHGDNTDDNGGDGEETMLVAVMAVMTVEMMMVGRRCW